MSSEPLRILLIEDNPGDVRLIQEMFRGVAGLKLELAKRLAEGLAKVEAGGIDAVLLDLGLPDSAGPETLSRWRSAVSGLPVIVLTGVEDDEFGLRLVREGAQDYLPKGRANAELLLRTVRYAVGRQRAEQELRSAEARLKHVMTSLPVVVYAAEIAEEAGVWQPRWVGEDIESLTGFTREETLSPTWWTEGVHPDDREKAAAEIRPDAERPHRTGEYRFRHKDGEYRWIYDEVRLVGDSGTGTAEAFGAWLDITERRSLEAQLNRSQKMEAIGRLAGGVAHDFNNLLTVILSTTRFLRSDLSDSDPRAQDLDDIMQAAEGGAALTRQLLAFGREQVLAPQPMNLNDLISGLESLLRRTIGEDVDMRTALAPDLWSVFADPGQIEQVILNLALNARDAMPKGGRLVIETANVDLDRDYAGAHGPVQPGPYVMFAVSDTGDGMNEETRARIFEPFFTTKSAGKGTGLGLATVYGVVKQSGGYIWVYSEVDQGTSFKVYLPKVEVSGIRSKDLRREAAVAEPAPQGAETILLVEDDAAVRRVTARTLDWLGYEVVQVENAEEALEVVDRRGDPLHAVVTDVVLPGISGPDLARRLRSDHPEIGVLLLSGYTEGRVEIERGSDVAFLQKPFTPEGLARKVREVLDRPVQPA